MELSLRKARKLEAKIQKTADELSLSSTLKVRALASPQERASALDQARRAYNDLLLKQKELIVVRFTIRDLISKANADTGINTLMAQREAVQALLAKSSASVDALDLAEAEDLANARKNSLEKGERGYGGDTVTVTLPVSTKEDVEGFKAADAELKKKLEEIEDELSQKNLGVKITINEASVTLLQSLDLV